MPAIFTDRSTALIVNGARPDDDEQARVFLIEDADNAFAAHGHGGGGFGRGRKRGLHHAGRGEADYFADMQILRLEHRREYSGKLRGQKKF